MEQTRRTLLASVGTVLAAGCLSAGSRTGEPTSETTDTTTRTATTTDTATPTTEPGSATTAGDEVTVTDVTVTPQYVAFSTPDSISTYGERDQQFVIATVRTETEGPDSAEFALETDGDTFAPDEDVGGMGGNLWRDGGIAQPYGEASQGWVAFSVPNPLDAETVSITWPGGEYPLGEDTLTRLTKPPTSFELRALDAPDTVHRDEDVTVTLTVENTGDHRGTFVGALNRSGPSVAYAPEASVALGVPAGETTTWEYTNTPDDRYGSGGDDAEMQLRLQWRDGDRSVTVDIEGDDG